MLRETIKALVKDLTEVPPKGTQSLEQKEKNKALERVAKKLSSFILAGTFLGGTFVIYGQYANSVFESRARESLEYIKELVLKEKEVKRYFGSYFPAGSKAESYELWREKKKYWDTTRSVERKTCPVCGFKHSAETAFCPRTEDKIEGYKERQEKEKIYLTSIITEGGVIREGELKQYLETLPKRWINPSIKQIVQTVYSKYSNLEGKGTLATCVRSGLGGERAEVTFYSSSIKNSLQYVIRAISHEIAHANDWDNPFISYEDKLDLLVKISRRIISKDRFYSAYVESIEGKDYYETNSTKAAEYWAEIAAQYFEDPTKLHIEDFRIVNEYIRKTDPNFNPEKSQGRRKEIVDSFRYNRFFIVYRDPSPTQ